ncbi:transposase [Enterobacter cloacae]|uniref:phage polarity suppression protein n=1 Tax=Enterobacter cloacae TaxID=550 RepID=UPI001D00DC36|nr:transposase [Enterobacter cloacae]
MKKRFSDEQIISILLEAEAGVSASELCRKHAISDATFYTWRKKYGGMEVPEVKRLWLAAGEKINYADQDSDILTTIRFRPDAASRDDNREKFPPAQNQNYVNKRAQLAAQ